ncbi:signal transduction histidine-protein kinase AtoS [Abditibacteriota bacterium]|nr:signal transduction histidine-protein kinase AtoS [Abditibacteriota bacterium]
MRTGFIVEETFCESPFRISRAMRESDAKIALLFEIPGATLPPGELADVSALLSLHNPRSGLSFAWEDSGAPLCSLRAPLAVGDFLPIALGLVQSLGTQHENGGFYRFLGDTTILLAEGTAHLAPPAAASLVFEAMTARSEAGDAKARWWTLRFLAPEQSGRMDRSPDLRADLYALGVVFFQLLTGQLPFSSTDALELLHSHLAKTPTALHEQNPQVPRVLSDIVAKLLAKTPEERYQGTFGLGEDLRECQIRWQNGSDIEWFDIARHDVAEQLTFPPHLYGREEERRVLERAFCRVQEEGAATLVLLGGYSGVGKTALAQSLRPGVIAAHGTFLSGKIDQFHRNSPYASIREAFGGLVRSWQTESAPYIARKREELRHALGENGQVLVDVVPELEDIIGAQASVPALEPAEATIRFNATFKAFIEALASPGQPLVVFLDDLQWVDAASLKLMESLLGSAGHLLLIGAYRDNEVSASHPLMASAARLEASDSERVRWVNLKPLSLASVTQLLSDTLHRPAEDVRALARLLLQKTDGNAFFLLQFLGALYADKLLRFEHARGRWHWDAQRILHAGISGDVVELMAGKIRSLSSAARAALPMAACLGNRFSLEDLSLVGEARENSGHSLESIAGQATLADLQEALDAGLLVPIAEDAGRPTHFRFLHDRVQQAADSLLSEEEKTALHERVGRLLTEQARAEGEDAFEERLFEIANHLNRGMTLIRGEESLGELAQFNLRAALKAKNALAYDVALRYAQGGIEALSQRLPGTSRLEHSDEQKRIVRFELHFERSECAFLLGDLSEMEKQLDELADLASTPIQRARVYDLKVVFLATSARLTEAIAVGSKGLRSLGMTVPPTISKASIVGEIARVRWLQRGRKPHDLLQLLLVEDTEQLAMLKLLSNVVAAAFFSDADLFAFLILKLTGISMQIGNSPIAPMGYGCYGIILCSPLGDYRAGWEFGQVAVELSRRSGDKSSFSRATLITGGFLHFWGAPLAQTTTLLREGYEAGAEAGDSLYASFNTLHVVFQRLFHGDDLNDVETENERYRDFTRRVGYQEGTEYLSLYTQYIACLQGRTRQRGSFADDNFDEAARERTFAAALNRLPFLYHATLKMEALYLLGQPREALRIAKRVLREPKKLEPLGSLLFVASFHLYHPLAQAIEYPRALTREKRGIRLNLELAQRRFRKWANLCPENFAHLERLLSAELARVRGDKGGAQMLYEKAIVLANRNGFPHHAALANERAGTLSLERGARKLAGLHLGEAREGFARWGASEKVRQLDERFGVLLNATSSPLSSELPLEDVPLASVETVSATLDLSTVIKAAQAISGEIEWPRLLRVLMNIAIENAGAERGVLLLENGDELHLAAQGEAGAVEVLPLEGRALTSQDAAHLLPMSVVNYVARTRENVVLNNAFASDLFGGDPFIAASGTRSVLCAPILQQGRLVGVFYLQNDLAEGAFTENRLRVLTLLSGQAAVSLEAARAYALVRQSEGQLQAILDNAETAIFMKDLQGHYMMANAEFLRVFGVSQEKVLGATIFDLVPHEQAEQLHAHDQRVITESQALQWEETVLVRGEERTFLSAKFPLFDVQGTMYALGSVSTDITERKRAEKVLTHYNRALEEQVVERTHDLRERNSQLQVTLDQLKDAQQRVIVQEKMASLGALTAGIAHEIKNPLNFVNNFAALSVDLVGELEDELEKLTASLDPDDDTREYLTEILSDLKSNAQKINEHGGRADSIVRNMLLHSRGQTSAPEAVDLNSLVREAVQLAYHGQRARNSNFNITLEEEYGAGLEQAKVLPHELSRVILNLANNAFYATNQKASRLGRDFVPTIRILTVKHDTSFEVRIADNGNGIPDEVREKIFTPFFTTKPTGEGTGLGLSMSYDIVVQQHSGEIRVQSTPGEGTEFTVILPA